jgi:6-phosphofructokinase 1
MIAVCEGQRDEQGGWFGAELITRPGARDPLPANMGHVIAKLLWDRTGLRARAEKPGLLGRSCAALASDVDRADACNCGKAAVRAAIARESGVMVTLRPLGGGPATGLAPLDRVARRERPFPREWMNAERNDVAPAYVDWARPLIGAILPHGLL